MPTILETDIGEIELPDSWSPEQIQDYAQNQLPTLREGLKKGAAADLASRAPRDLAVAGGGVIQGLARLPYSIFGPRSETSVRTNLRQLGLQAALNSPLGEEKAIIEGADEAANRAELNAMKLAQAREAQLAKDPVYKFGGESNQAAREFYATNPLLDDSVLAKGSAAVTSTIPVIAAAPAGPIAMAAVYGAMSGQQGAEEAIERGRPDLADEAYLAYAGLGALSEAALGYPMALIRGIRAARRAGVPPAAFGEMAKRSFPQLVGQVARESGRASIREAIQESTEQFGQNVAAREIGFDPNRELSQGVGEAALYGGAVGGLFGAGFGGAQAYDARPRSQISQIDRLLRENRLDLRPIDPQLADIQARESMRPEYAQRTVVPAMLQPTPPVADYFLDDVEQTPLPPRRRPITPAPESPRFRPPPVTPNVAPEQETPVSRPPTPPPVAPPLAPSTTQPTPPVQTPPVPPVTPPVTPEVPNAVPPVVPIGKRQQLKELFKELKGKQYTKERFKSLHDDIRRVKVEIADEEVAKVPSNATAVRLHSDKWLGDKFPMDVLITPSTDPKYKGKWQATKMDERGPMGHEVFDSIQDAIRSWTGIRVKSEPPHGDQSFSVAEVRTNKTKPPEVPVTPQVEGQLGAQTTISTPREGKKVGAQYVVVEASDLATSFDSGFDSNLQPRDRTRQASANQIQEIATRFEPQRMGESVTSDTGAPIVDERNQVLSGNGRTSALRLLYDSADARAESYKNFLTQNASDFGIEPQQVQGMKNPVLVRRVTNYGELTKEQFTRQSNEQQVLGLSESEKASVDARMLLQSNLLDNFMPSETGDVLSATNREFLNRFIDATGSQAELLSKDGYNGPLLSKRVRNAVLGALIGAENKTLLDDLIERTDTLQIKNAVNALLASAPQLVKLKGTEYDLSTVLAQAMRDLVHIRSGGIKVQDYLSQTLLFGDAGRTAESDFLLRQLDAAKSQKAITEPLLRYAESVRKMDTTTQDMFGQSNAPMSDVLKRSYESQKAEQTKDLAFAKPQGSIGETVSTAESSPEGVRQGSAGRRQVIEGIRGGEWISGFITKTGDMITGHKKPWGHHPDILDQNRWLLKEAGYNDSEMEGVINDVAKGTEISLRRLARRGLYAFIVMSDGETHFDVEAPTELKQKVQKYADNLPRTSQASISSDLSVAIQSEPIGVGRGVDGMRNLIEGAGNKIPAAARQVITAWMNTPAMRDLDWDYMALQLWTGRTLEDGLAGVRMGDVIRLALQSNPETAPHEFAHVLYDFLPEKYKAFVESKRKEAVLAKYGENAPQALLDGQMTTEEFLNSDGVAIEDYSMINASEFMAKFVGQKFADETFSNRHQERTVWTKIKEWFQGVMDGLRRALKVSPTMERVYREMIAGTWKPTTESIQAMREGESQGSLEEVFQSKQSLDEFIAKPTVSQEEAQSLRRQAGARAALVPDEIADEIRALDSKDPIEKRMAGLLEFVLRMHGLAPALEIQRILADTNLSDDMKDAAISAVLRAIEHVRIKTNEVDDHLQQAMAELARQTKTMGKVTGEQLVEAKAKDTVEKLIIGYRAYLTAQAANLPADQNLAAARQQVIRNLEGMLNRATTLPSASMKVIQAIANRIDELPVAQGPAAVIEAIKSKGILNGVADDWTIDLLTEEKPGGFLPLLLNPQTNELLIQLATLQKRADVYAKQNEVFEQAFRGKGEVTPVELKKWAETYRKFRNKQAEAHKAIAEMDKAFRKADESVQVYTRTKEILERLQNDQAFRAQFQAVIDIPGGSIFKDIVDTPGDTRIKEYTSPLAQEDADGNVVYRKYRVLLAPDRQADEQTMREMALLVGEIDEFLAGDVTPIERRTWTQLRDYIRKYQLIPMFATTVPGWSFETGAGIIELNPWAMVQVLAGGRARAPRSEMEKMTLRAADMANTAFRVGDQSLNGYRLIRNNREYGDEVSKIAVLAAVKSHKHEVTGEPWDYTRIEHWNEWVLNPIIASGQTPGQMRLGVGDYVPGTGIKITKEDMAAARLQKRFSQAVVQTTQGTAKNLPPLLRDNPILVEDEFAGRPTKRRAFGTGPLTMARRFSQWARVFSHLWTTATPDGRRRLLADDRNFRLAALGYVTTTNPEYQTSSPLKPIYEEYTARARTDEDQQVQSFDQLVDRLAEIAVSKGIFPDMATAVPQIEATLLQEIDQVVKAFAAQIAQQGHEGDTPQAIVATASSRNAFTTARQQMVAPDTFYDYTLTSANDRIAFVAGGYQMFQEKQVAALKDLQTALKLELDKLEQQIVTLTPKVGQKRAYSEVQKQTAKEQELGERRFTYMRLQQHKRTIDKLVDDLSKMVIDVRDPNDAAALLALSRFQSTLSSGLLASPMAMANNYFGGGVAASYLTMLNLGRARMLLPVKALGNLVSVLPRRLLASYPSRTFIGKFARSHIKVVRQMARLIEEQIANEIYFHTEAEAWGLRSPPDMRNRLKAAKELKGTAGQIIYGKPELLKSIPNWMESIPGFRQFFTLLRDLSPRFIDEQVNAATARTFQSEAFGWLKLAAVKAFDAREKLAAKTGADISDFTQRSNLLTPEELGLHKSHGFRDLTRLRQLFQTVGTLDGHLLDYYKRWKAAPEGENADVPLFVDPAAEGSVLFDMEAHGNIPTTGFTPPAMAGVGQNGVIKRLIFMFQNYVLRTGAQLERLPEKDLRDPKGWREAYGFWAVFLALMAFLLSGMMATETGVPLTKAITGRAPSRVTAANVLADPDAAILARYAGMALGNNFPYYGKVISEMLGNPGYGSAWDAANLIPVAGLVRDLATMGKRMGQTGDPVFPALDFLGRWMPPLSPAIRLAPGMSGDIQAKNAARALRVVGPSEGMELAGGGGATAAQTPVTPEIRRLLAAAYQGDADGIRKAFDAAVSAKQATGSPDPVRAVKQSLAAAIPARRVYGRSITAAEEQGLIGRMTDSQRADYSGAQQAFSLINQTLGTNYRLTSAPPKLKTSSRRRQLRGRSSRLPSIKRSRVSRRSPFRSRRRLAGRRRRRNPSFSMAA